MNKFIKASIVLGAVFALALPTLSYAASYGYVDTQGLVREVIADNWQAAIANAPGIAYNSGVCLLDSATDRSMLGTSVPQ